VLLVSLWLRLANNELYLDDVSEKFRLGPHPHVRYTRVSAAKVIDIPYKTLNDYILMIRKGRDDAFEFPRF
jgi:hypothetical protein